MSDRPITPGPWIWEPRSRGNLYEMRSLSGPPGEGLVLQANYEVKGYHHAEEYIDGYPEDFACLAAAPELLAACEAALPCVENYQSDLGICDSGLRPVIQQLRDAITKAKGGAK